MSLEIEKQKKQEQEEEALAPPLGSSPRDSPPGPEEAVEEGEIDLWYSEILPL